MVHLVVLGDHQNPARVAVEPMDDARPELSGNVAKLVEMKLQGARQSSAIVALAGVHNQSGRLVEHDNRLVFMHDVERNVFRRQCAVRQLGKPHRDDVVDPQLPRRLDRNAVNENRLLINGFLKKHPAEIRKDAAQIVIDTPAVGAGLDGD